MGKLRPGTDVTEGEGLSSLIGLITGLKPAQPLGPLAWTPANSLPAVSLPEGSASSPISLTNDCLTNISDIENGTLRRNGLPPCLTPEHSSVFSLLLAELNQYASTSAQTSRKRS